MENHESPTTLNQILSSPPNSSLVDPAKPGSPTESHKLGASISLDEVECYDAECYDAVILYSKKDLETAEKIVAGINSILLKGNSRAKAELFDVACAFITPMLSHLEKVLQVCSYVFILCTENFNGDVEKKYLADECIMSSILSKDTEKPWQVVPIVMDPDIRLQFGLNALQPIKWYSKHALVKIGNLFKKCNRRDLMRSQSMPVAIQSGQEWTSNSNQSINRCMDSINALSIEPTITNLQESKSINENQESHSTSSFKSMTNLQENKIMNES